MDRRQLGLTAATAYVVAAAVLTAAGITMDAADLGAAALAVTVPVSLAGVSAHLDLLTAVDAVAPQLVNWANVVGVAALAVLNVLLLRGVWRAIARR